jgi:hypothetical protein
MNPFLFARFGFAVAALALGAGDADVAVFGSAVRASGANAARTAEDRRKVRRFTAMKGSGWEQAFLSIQFGDEQAGTPGATGKPRNANVSSWFRVS